VLCGVVTQEIVDRVRVNRQAARDEHGDASRGAPR
jgi:hypothetical protein